MAQFDFPTLDANVNNGTQLANWLNQFMTANDTQHSGSTRPSYAGAGFLWLDTSATPSRLRLFDGTADLTMASFSGGSLSLLLGPSGSPASLSVTGGTITASVPVALTHASLNSGPLAGLRNAIINGDFRVNQRNATTVTVVDGYPSDRWIVRAAGGSRTAQRVVLTDADRTAIGSQAVTHAMQYAATGGATGGNFEAISQRIEGVRTFAGQTVTLSFWARRTAGTGNVSSELSQTFGTGGTPSASVTGLGATQHTLTTSWQRFTVTTTIPAVTGATLGTNGDDALALLLYFSATATFNPRTGSLPVQTVTVQIADVQIEPGSVATPFERRFIGQELRLCQRYYWQTDVNMIIGGTMLTGIAPSVYLAVHYPAEMRAVPTITPSYANGVGNLAQGFIYVGRRGGTLFVQGNGANNGGFGVELVAGCPFNAEL